jgi:large subunit ribosomal protein L25
MAEIVLNVEVRERAGSGGARAARREGKVPGVLYGGKLGPVAVVVRQAEFRKALYSGQLLGRLVTLRYGEETQPVIGKDVQFHPVTDEPTHFDLYRVEAHQQIRIAIPVRFRNHEASPGIKRGGVLNINLHELELLVPADQIPEEVAIDLTGLDIGDGVRGADLTLPASAELPAQLREATIASIAAPAALLAEEETVTEEGAEAEAAEGPEAEAEPES